MRFILSLLLLFFVMIYGLTGTDTLAATWVQAPGNRGSDLSSPEATLRSFMAALNRADLKSAAAFVNDGRVENAADWFEDMMRQDRWMYTATDFRAEINGAVAVVRVRTNLRCDTPIGPQVPLVNEEILTVRRVGIEWKIVPAEETAKNVPGYGMVQRAAMMLARNKAGQARKRNEKKSLTDCTRSETPTDEKCKKSYSAALHSQCDLDAANFVLPCPDQYFGSEPRRQDRRIHERHD